MIETLRAMQWPMGTVMAGCMLLTLLFASRVPYLGLNRISPPGVLISVGALAIAAGLWNFGWYGLQHLGERWGNAAAASGLLLIFTGGYLLREVPVGSLVARIRPVVVLGLAGLAMFYTIGVLRL